MGKALRVYVRDYKNKDDRIELEDGWVCKSEGVIDIVEFRIVKQDEKYVPPQGMSVVQCCKYIEKQLDNVVGDGRTCMLERILEELDNESVDQYGTVFFMVLN